MFPSNANLEILILNNRSLPGARRDHQTLDLVGLIRVGRSRGRRLVRQKSWRSAPGLRVLLLLLLLLALQFLQQLFGRLRSLLGLVWLILLVGLIYRLFVSHVRLVGRVIRRLRIIGRSDNGGLPRTESALRDGGPIGGIRSCIRSTRLGRQHDALDGGWVFGGPDHDVVEVSTVQQLRKDVACRARAEIGDHSLARIRRDLEVRAGLLANCLQYVREGGIVGHDRQLTATILDTWSHGGYLVERQRLKRSRSIRGERWGCRLFLFLLLFWWLADPALLSRGKR